MIKGIISWLSPRRIAIERWVRVHGDETLRLNYAMDANSIVLDLGGYKGDFTAAMAERYNCNVLVFEPVPIFAEEIKNRFKDNERVQVFDFGLEEKDRSDNISLHDEGSSSYKSYDESDRITIEYKSVTDFFESYNLENVDLMKINIEGGEYDLLESMIDSNLVTRVNNYQIQFHDIKSIDSKKRMKRIQNRLKKTHKVTWKFRPYVWENWERKKTE